MGANLTSANSTRADWPAIGCDDDAPLPDGNRVLQSIARQEAMPSLLAFSGFHEQIRNRRLAPERFSDLDLSETERFILDEVLQLICDRIHALSHADGVVVALVEQATSNGSKPAPSKQEHSNFERPKIVCRAAAGPLATKPDNPFDGESALLQECLNTGRRLCVDDCQNNDRRNNDRPSNDRPNDARPNHDCRNDDRQNETGLGSTVLVPLGGSRHPLGVLQLFSKNPGAFTERDLRCFDLFAELLLSALKPEDQDRRIHWLSEVTEDVLRTIPANTASVETGLAPSRAAQPRPDLHTTSSVSHLATIFQSLPIPEETIDLPMPELAEPEFSESQFSEHEFSELEFSEPDFSKSESADVPFDEQSFKILQTIPAEPRPAFGLSFLRRTSVAGHSRPGLSVVIGLVAVAAVFSAGAWWGMKPHGKTAAKAAAANLAATNPASQTSALTTAAPLSDNLMAPSKVDSDATSLAAVAQDQDKDQDKDKDKLTPLPRVTQLRHWSSPLGSTVVIDMEDQVPYEVHRLISPDRIYFDLHDTLLAPELDGKTIDIGDASLTRVRIAQPITGVTRIVLDTRDGSNFSVSMESNPYRLVIELRGSEKALAADKSAPNQLPSHQLASPQASSNQTSASLDRMPDTMTAAPASASALTAKTSDQALPSQAAPLKTFPIKTGKFRIVLDPGHGGWDLGTVGRQGLLEKDLVLDVTERLGKLLQMRLGSEVMFTRSDDTYLPLEQRADFANRSQADLFVSVHANYSTSTAARGVETYYTNLFSAPGSREVERHDDGTFTNLTPVSLPAGDLHEKIEESRRLAASVQHSLYSTLSANSPNIRNRGIKASAFVVLTGTTMPAILTEISFVSSPADERSLQSAAYRQQIAEALYQGIAHYQESSPHAKVAQLQKPGTQ
jgi:N-acetylmuramoyl-L-alanine amidase